MFSGNIHDHGLYRKVMWHCVYVCTWVLSCHNLQFQGHIGHIDDGVVTFYSMFMLSPVNNFMILDLEITLLSVQSSSSPVS